MTIAFATVVTTVMFGWVGYNIGHAKGYERARKDAVRIVTAWNSRKER